MCTDYGEGLWHGLCTTALRAWAYCAHVLKAETPTGACHAGIPGTIGAGSFSNNWCAPQPTGELAVQHNPICSVQAYRGGLLSCCRDGQSLFDTNQDIPWPDEYLEYYIKFRFYFEEYQALTINNRNSYIGTHFANALITYIIL